MNAKRLVISLAAAATLGLSAAPAYADEYHAWFGSTSFIDHGLVCCGDAAATGGGGAYISPDYEAEGSGHVWFGSTPFVDYGYVSPAGSTGGAAAVAPASSNDGVVRSEVFNPAG